MLGQRGLALLRLAVLLLAFFDPCIGKSSLIKASSFSCITLRWRSALGFARASVPYKEPCKPLSG